MYSFVLGASRPTRDRYATPFVKLTPLGQGVAQRFADKGAFGLPLTREWRLPRLNFLFCSSCLAHIKEDMGLHPMDWNAAPSALYEINPSRLVPIRSPVLVWLNSYEPCINAKNLPATFLAPRWELVLSPLGESRSRQV